VVLSVISAAALLFAIVWEWRHKDPIVDLHLFRQRTFATANFLMFMLGFALLGSTLLLPLFAQTLLGYTAEQAGLALSPGGFTILVLLPLVGFLISRYDGRWLIAFGLTTLSLALLHMTTFDLAVDFRTVVLARCFQGAGLAFLFVPINTAAYSSLPREKNNAASGLMNLARNIGGSVGISFVTTLLARRTQYHQARLSENLTAGSGPLNNLLQGLAATFRRGGLDAATALQKAYAMLQANVIQQATMQAYVDCFWMLGTVMICLVPVVFVMKKAKPGGAIAAH
jgi:DHA2 family multidrug resistance protein